MQNYYIGSVLLVAFNRLPEGWALCNGQELPINSNQALFSLLGTTYGGDARTTFALPNLNAGALQSGMQYLICVNGVYPNFN
ncbi:MAG TPA: tail fiber protein [Acidobacteriaceae bacterium]|jgi:microcystin-dependent protein|nr:tail fiber protein [Acidobacteriaceae bacterium]